jgi:hypothetical protein
LHGKQRIEKTQRAIKGAREGKQKRKKEGEGEKRKTRKKYGKSLEKEILTVV